MDELKVTQNMLDKSIRVEIENKVNELFDTIGYDLNQAPIDVINIASKLGFVVGNAVLNNNDDGFIIVEEGREEIFGFKTDKLIGINSQRSLEWKRFIIAHEIGHYILEYKNDNLKGLYANRYHSRGHDKNENQIDYFAACLLMPASIFKKTYEEFKKTTLSSSTIVTILASYFSVTTKMTERRIEELGLS